MGFASVGLIARAAAFVGVVALVSAASACAERDSSDQPTERQHPAQFAADLYQSGADGEWEDVRASLVEPFDDYESEQLQAGLAFPRWSPDLSDSERWQVEEHSGFVIARSSENPELALVLKPDDEGSWRYDPGGRALMLIERRSADIESPGLPRETNGMPEDAPYQSTVESQARASVIHQHFQRQLGPIIPGDETIAITLHMTLQGAEEVRLPLNGISASAADGSALDTNLTGTTAIVEDGVATMPVPGGGRAAYRLSLEIDRPADADSFELTFDGLEIVVPRGVDGNALEFDLHYDDVSVMTLPDYLDA